MIFATAFAAVVFLAALEIRAVQIWKSAILRESYRVGQHISSVVGMSWIAMHQKLCSIFLLVSLFQYLVILRIDQMRLFSSTKVS